MVRGSAQEQCSGEAGVRVRVRVRVTVRVRARVRVRVRVARDSMTE